MIFKLKTSQKTQQIFAEIGKSTSLKPYTLVKHAIAWSLKEQGKITSFSSDNEGLELNRQTITGEYDDLAEIGQALDHMGKYYFKYTGELDAQKERLTILKEFRQGIRKILLAVGCLDEGIDIPACDVAVFISSSTSERQFIQRRGLSFHLLESIR